MRNNTDKSGMRGNQTGGSQTGGSQTSEGKVSRIRRSIQNRKMRWEMRWSRMGALAACLVFCVFLVHGTADAEEYKYDALGRLEEVIYENGDSVRYSYDANGNIQSCEYQTGNGDVQQPDKPSAGTGEEQPSAGTGEERPSTGTGEEQPSGGSGAEGQENKENSGAEDQENKENSGADDKGQNDKEQNDKGQSDNKEQDDKKQDDKKQENAASAQKVKTGDIHKTKNAQYQILSTGKNRTAALKRFTDRKAQKFTIPAAIRIGDQKYQVVMIAPKAFRNKTKLKQVTIGKNVTSIGSRAFYKCRSLKKIIVRTGKLKAVGRNAFSGISKKAVVKVPKKQYQRYVKLFRHKGQAGSVKMR